MARNYHFTGFSSLSHSFYLLLHLHCKSAREEELAEKTARLKELNILLNMDEKDKTLLDDTPDEGEDVPARRVAELAR